MSAAGWSLTQRVTWALTGTVVAAIALISLMMYLVQGEMEQRWVLRGLEVEADRVEARMEALRETWGRPFVRQVSPNTYVWGEHPDRPADSLPPALRSLSDGEHPVHLNGERWQVLVRPLLDGRVYVMQNTSESERRLARFGWWLLVLASLFVGISYVVGRRVARLTVSPLVDLTDRLEHWAPGAPGWVPGRRDEAGRLVEAFNRVQDRVDASIAREREFAANLSHEVRTPLTALRSDTEMMLHSADRPPTERQRLERILRNVDAVVQTLESTRSVAQDRRGPAEDVMLHAVVDDVYTSLGDEARAARLQLVNAVPLPRVARVDRYALLTLLRNLVRNAMAHAAPATLTIATTPQGLVLRDDGPGIDAADLPWVFERYYRGRHGDGRGARDSAQGEGGLGLAIAKRVADTHGWHLSVVSPPAGHTQGTEFQLWLGPARGEFH